MAQLLAAVVDTAGLALARTTDTAGPDHLSAVMTAVMTGMTTGAMEVVVTMTGTVVTMTGTAATMTGTVVTTAVMTDIVARGPDRTVKSLQHRTSSVYCDNGNQVPGPPVCVCVC